MKTSFFTLLVASCALILISSSTTSSVSASNLKHGMLTPQGGIQPCYPPPCPGYQYIHGVGDPQSAMEKIQSGEDPAQSSSGEAESGAAADGSSETGSSETSSPSSDGSSSSVGSGPSATSNPKSKTVDSDAFAPGESPTEADLKDPWVVVQTPPPHVEAPRLESCNKCDDEDVEKQRKRLRKLVATLENARRSIEPSDTWLFSAAKAREKLAAEVDRVHAEVDGVKGHMAHLKDQITTLRNNIRSQELENSILHAKEQLHALKTNNRDVHTTKARLLQTKLKLEQKMNKIKGQLKGLKKAHKKLGGGADSDLENSGIEQ